jgi:hypothetical protein
MGKLQGMAGWAATTVAHFCPGVTGLKDDLNDLVHLFESNGWHEFTVKQNRRVTLVRNPKCHFTLGCNGCERRCDKRRSDHVREGEVTGEQQSTFVMWICDTAGLFTRSGMWRRCALVRRGDRWWLAFKILVEGRIRRQ